MTRVPLQAGLTLVELLVALAITAILVVPLAGMFQGASSGSITAQAALDLNADARLVLDRIVQRTAALPAYTANASVVNPAGWLLPLTYTINGTNLVETDSTAKPVRTSVIAANVSAFALTTQDVGDGQYVLKITLTLAAQGNSVTASRSVRVGASI